MVEEQKNNLNCPILFYNLLEWHLANFHCGHVGSTHADRRRGIKGPSRDKLSRKCQPFMLLRRPISYLLQQAFCVRYFRFLSSPHCKSSANLPPLRISASPDAIFLPPTAHPRTPTPPLMWQNKPRPIRIKALKRSLKPLKVPLNWGTTIWAVWQQMLNGAIARPPRWGLLSHHARVWKHSRA